VPLTEPVADRHALGHFGLPAGNRSITLNTRIMVEKGRVLEI
jgi:hypothetical protein